MSQSTNTRRISILRNRSDAERPKKRASFSSDVRDGNRRLSLNRQSEETSENQSEDVGDSFGISSNYIKAMQRSGSVDGSDTSTGGGTFATTLNQLFRCFTEERAQSLIFLIEHPAWKAYILFLTFILIFGGPIRDFCPKTSDPYFDVLFVIVLVLLLIDIAIMCMIKPSYFVFKPSTQFRKYTNEYGCFCFSFQFGSFLFWFDIVSVLSFLTEISYINKSLIQIPQEHLFVNPFGIPKNLGTVHPLNLNISFIVDILVRTLRLVRLVRVDTINTLQSISARVIEALQCIRSSDKISRNNNHSSKNKGIFKGDNEVSEIERAVVKIQRAWRNSRNDAVGGFYEASTSPSALRHQSNQPNDDETKVTGVTRAIQKSDYSTSLKAKLRMKKFGLQSYTLTPSPGKRKKEKRTSQKKKKSQIGSAMHEMTMRRVVIGMLIAVIFNVVFAYLERSRTSKLTVVTIHNAMVLLQESGSNEPLSNYGRNLTAIARLSSAPELCTFQFTSANQNYTDSYCEDQYLDDIRNREMLRISVCSLEEGEIIKDMKYGNCSGAQSSSLFAFRYGARNTAFVYLLFQIFVLILGPLGLLYFVGPVTTLVVSPIEQMIRLLSMLVNDPLGYSRTKKYKTFMNEDNELAKGTMWTQESLNGMETSFLMSTLLRIGSLMKVGFGSAGVEIIRSNIGKSFHDSSLNDSISISVSNQQRDSMVACIFMFCDIRGFTDSSECLNEEVFVFTNRIAAVVHSYCHAYGGSANKNVGDAFLLSWKLDAPDSHQEGVFVAKNKQADKALLAVVKICIALYHESFFLEGLSDGSVEALKRKFSKRPGLLVQLGFGLHAGRAVEGAIGSQRKLDATYLSEAVELSEYLESSTKKYGVNILMSGSFLKLLHPNVSQMCRKIDHIFLTDEFEEYDPREVSMTEEISDDFNNFNIHHMSLHTFDMDIDMLFRNKNKEDLIINPQELDSPLRNKTTSIRSLNSDDNVRTSSKRSIMRRMSIFGSGQAELQSFRREDESIKSNQEFRKAEDIAERTLEIPEGTLVYTPSLWHFEEIRRIRSRFTPMFFQKFKAGYHAYISGDWNEANMIFQFMVDKYQDKPSQYFLDKMEASNNVAPTYFHISLGDITLNRWSS